MFVAGERLEINGVPLEMSGESFMVTGHGDVYTAKLLKAFTSKELSDNLRGQIVKNRKIRAVEMFAVYDQPAGRPIGILLGDEYEIRSGAV